jgi:hypothetical protein
MRSKLLQEAAVPDRCLGTLVVDGVHCPVTTMLDELGEETLDRSEAMVAIVLMPSGRWLSAEVSSSGIWPLQ